MKKSSWIEIGSCGTTHGVKGAFSFRSHNPSFQKQKTVLREGLKVLLSPLSLDNQQELSSTGQLFTLNAVQSAHKFIISFEEVHDYESAKKLLPFTVSVQREDFPHLTVQDEYYTVDLIGLPVFREGTNEQMGVIKDIYSNGAHDVVTITYDENRKEIDLPFVSAFFPLVDLEIGRIEVADFQTIDGEEV